MSRVALADTRKSLATKLVAVGVSADHPDSEQLHSLLLYKWRNVWYCLHFLRKIQVTPLVNYVKLCAAAQIDHILSSYEINSLAKTAHEISRVSRGRELPFGFSHHADWIDSQTGEVMPKKEDGLTCSRFVLAIFWSNGHRLVNSLGWPIRIADLKWAWELAIKRRPFKRQLRDCFQLITHRRVRPDELAGAAISDRWPCKYKHAKKGSLVVRGVLGR